MSTAPRILAALAFIGAAQSVNAETILFAGDQGVVHALDTQTGTVSFRGVCSGPVSSMVVHDGTLYLGDNNGVFYNYDVATNLVQSAFFVDTDASAMTWLGDQLVIADSSGRVDYIDPDTGEVDHSVENLSTDITAIGIDAGGRNRPDGLPVRSVLRDGPAAQVGLVPGDTLRAIDGTPIDSANTLTGLLDQRHGGDVVTMEWTDRSGTPQSAAVTLVPGPVS